MSHEPKNRQLDKRNRNSRIYTPSNLEAKSCSLAISEVSMRRGSKNQPGLQVPWLPVKHNQKTFPLSLTLCTACLSLIPHTEPNPSSQDPCGACAAHLIPVAVGMPSSFLLFSESLHCFMKVSGLIHGLERARARQSPLCQPAT